MYKLITEDKGINEIREKISDVRILSLDIETNSLDPIGGKVLLIQICIEDEIFIINALTVSKDSISSLLNDIRNICSIGHNIKFDIKFLKTNFGVLLENVHDTMLTEVLLYQGIGKKFYSLQELALDYCDVTLDKTFQASFENMSNGIFTESQLLYSALDVKHLKKIYDSQMEKVVESGQLETYRLEMRTVPVVAQMEINGIKIDVDHWKKLQIDSEERASILNLRIKSYFIECINNKGSVNNCLELADALRIPVKTKRDRCTLENMIDVNFINFWLIDNMNIDSPLQLKILLNLCGIAVENTNEKTLTTFSDNDIIKLILEYRGYIKRATSFGDKFIKIINPVTGRIHADAHQLGTDTGRYAYSNPNLQQIPKLPEYRKGFVAESGHKIITSDYEQCELKLAGSISGEPLFINAFINKKDLHRLTASIAFGVAYDDVTDEQRQVAKTLNFAILYGSSEAGLVWNFGFTKENASKLLNNFYNGYSRLSKFMEVAKEAIYKKGYSSTPLGRKRYFGKKVLYEDWKEASSEERRIKREGFNHIIQGANADITKEAMCKIHYENTFGNKLKIILLVHDEIVCEVSDDILNDAKDFIRYCMESAEQKYLGKIPAKVDMHINDYWSK